MTAFGHLSQQMLAHIVLMNAVAPVAALVWQRRVASPIVGRLMPAVIVQIVVLWSWHAPPVLASVAASPTLHLLMQVTLAGAALWFWLAVLGCSGAGRWRSILALLITAKLFCLLGILMVLSPRALYLSPDGTPLHGMHAIDDQQLAGLLMITACPLSYLVAGVVIAERWLRGIGAVEGMAREASIRRTG